MLYRLAGNREMPRCAYVFVGDHLVAPEHWKYCYPKHGSIITVRVTVHDATTLRTVAMIGVAVAAIAIAPYAVGFASQLSGVALSATAANVIGGLATGAVMAVGALAIDALIPLPQPKFESETRSDVLSVTGTRNQERPFSPLPQVLGTYRYTPPLAATPFTSNAGDDQNLTMLFTVGYGPLEITDPRIGNTSLDNFNGVTIQINEGYIDDEDITLYPGDVQQLPLNRRVYYGVYGQQCEDPHPQPNPCTQPGVTPITPPKDPPCDKQPNCYVETTPSLCHRFRVDITFPNGVLRIKDQGDRKPLEVPIEVWYREEGTTDFVFGASITVKAKTSSVLRRSIYVKPTSSDGTEKIYDVLVRRLRIDDREGKDPDGDNWRYSRTDWTSLVSYSSVNPISSSELPCNAQIALEITASSQLNGIIDNFNVLCRTICLDYTGTPGQWAKKPTNNPASLFRYVLQGNANKQAMADCRIDLDALEAWHTFCAIRGFTFNSVRDFSATVGDVLRDIAAAGRARPDQTYDGRWTVVVDDQSLYSPKQLFTPRNTWGFQASKNMIDQPHAFRCRFVDADNNYEQTSITVYADGYTELNATRFESIEFPGLTNATEVTNMALYRLRDARDRAERYQWNVDLEHLVVVAGNSCYLQNDSIKVGTGAARIKNINGNELTLDSEIEVPATPGMVMRVTADGSIHTLLVTAIDAIAGEYTDLWNLVSAQPAGMAVGDLVTIGELNSETLHLVVDKIFPGANDSALITAFPVAPATGAIG